MKIRMIRNVPTAFLDSDEQKLIPEAAANIRIYRGQPADAGALLDICAKADIPADMMQSMLGLPQAAIEAEVARISNVRALCKMAHLPSLGDTFARAGLPVEVVSNVILEVKAAIDDKLGIDGALTPDGSKGRKRSIHEEAYAQLNAAHEKTRS